MNDIQKQAIEKLQQQQAKHADGSAPFAVAEQLIAICQREPAAAALLNADLDNDEMSIVHAEAQIKKRADEIHRKTKSNSVCVSPAVAEAVLRKFYGLPNSGAAVPDTPAPDSDLFNLRVEDFL